MNNKLLFSLLLLSGIIQAAPVINPMEVLKERVFHATTPSAVLEAMERSKTQSTPKPRSALVDLLLRANYRATDNIARMNLVRTLAINDRNTAMAYTCFADSLNVQGKIVDEKTMQEIVNIQDGDGKSVLMHAVDQEDQASVHALIYGNTLILDARPAINIGKVSEAIAYATQINKPRALIAILPSARAITHAFENMPDASLAQLDTYYQALDILKKNNQHKASMYKKVVSQGTIAARLPEALQGSIQEMLHKTNPNDPAAMAPALEEAIVTGNLPALTHALNKECDLCLPNANGRNALELAAHHGQSQALKQLVENSPYVSEPQLKRLVEVTLGRLQEAQTIMNQSAQGVLIANLEATMKYLEEIPGYTTRMNTELIMAANEGHTGRILKALRHGANPDAKLDNGNPVIMLAILDNNPSLMKLLLKNGVDVNTIITGLNNSYGTLLNIALINNKQEIFNLLLEHGANVETKCSAGISPLVQSLFKDPKYMKALLAKGANPNSKERSDQENELSMLEWAIHLSKPEHTRILLEHGADAYYISLRNGYPLTYEALSNDSTEYLDLLLKHGADANAKVKSPRGNMFSLLDQACLKNKSEHAKILRKYGGKHTWIGLANKYRPNIIGVLIGLGLGHLIGRAIINIATFRSQAAIAH